MTEPIKIEIQYAKKDIFLSYLKYYFDGASVFYSFFGFLIFANTLILLFFDFRFTNILKLILFTLIFSVCWLFVILCISLNNSSNWQQSLEFIFSDDSVEYFNEHLKTKINWNYFVSANESFGIIDLVMYQQQKILIPTGNIDSQQLVEIRKLIKSKLGECARLKEASNKLGLR